MSRNRRAKKLFVVLFIVMLLSFTFVSQLVAASKKSAAYIESSAVAAEPDGNFISLDANGNLTALQAQNAPGGRTWYIDNIRFDSGAVASGSFHYDTQPYNPFAGQYGTYSNININVTSLDGTVREFRIVNPDSDGNERYLSMVAATGGDLTGAPFLALTPAISMTNAGGVIEILPGPQNLSYLGVCRSPDCGFAEEPYEEALAGGQIIAGPRIWHLTMYALILVPWQPVPLFMTRTPTTPLLASMAHTPTSTLM